MNVRPRRYGVRTSFGSHHHMDASTSCTTRAGEAAAVGTVGPMPLPGQVPHDRGREPIADEASIRLH
jgi:hypothetical protein